VKGLLIACFQTLKSTGGWGIFKWPQVGDFGWPPGVMRTRVQHTLSTLHGMVLALGGAWKNGSGKNHLLLSVPRKKRAWFCGLWANASGPP